MTPVAPQMRSRLLGKASAAFKDSLIQGCVQVFLYYVINLRFLRRETRSLLKSPTVSLSCCARQLQELQLPGRRRPDDPLGESDGGGQSGDTRSGTVTADKCSRLFCKQHASAPRKQTLPNAQKCEKSGKLVSSRLDGRPGAQIGSYYHYFPPF